MEILVTRDVYTSVQFIGFELTPCSLKETTAGHCQLSDVSPIQTSCEAFPKVSICVVFTNWGCVSMTTCISDVVCRKTLV